MLGKELNGFGKVLRMKDKRGAMKTSYSIKYWQRVSKSGHIAKVQN